MSGIDVRRQLPNVLLYFIKTSLNTSRNRSRKKSGTIKFIPNYLDWLSQLNKISAKRIYVASNERERYKRRGLGLFQRFAIRDAVCTSPQNFLTRPEVGCATLNFRLNWPETCPEWINMHLGVVFVSAVGVNMLLKLFSGSCWILF